MSDEEKCIIDTIGYYSVLDELEKAGTINKTNNGHEIMHF